MNIAYEVSKAINRAGPMVNPHDETRALGRLVLPKHFIDATKLAQDFEL